MFSMFTVRRGLTLTLLFVLLVLSFAMVACGGTTTTPTNSSASSTTSSSDATNNNTTGSTSSSDDATQIKNVDQQTQNTINDMDNVDQTATATNSQTDDNQIP